jgi:GNAT superfamily N-acetyltransferase
MNDADLYARVRACLLAELELFATGPGARLERRPGVCASIAPAVPAISLFNGIAHDSPAALIAAYDDLRAGYAAAGVRAFTVWLDPGDTASADALAARGHVLDASPTAMAAPIDEIASPPIGELDWRETDDVRLIGRINDAAYGIPVPAFVEALGPLPAGWRAYAARVDGVDAACLMAFDSADGDCGIAAVATLPIAQRRGISTGLLAVALRAARDRGAVTTTLQASSQGRPVYARLGYRDLGRMQMWEHRTA